MRLVSFAKRNIALTILWQTSSCADPNVDVIFVSPVPLSDETLQYYTKLLGLSAAVASGEVEDQCDMSDRYKVLVPEAIKSFPVRTLTYLGMGGLDVRAVGKM